MTTATATRTARTAVELPTGDAFEFFMSHNPQADQARIAARWQSAVALFEAGAVSSPNADGTRTVRSSRADAPDRQAGEPTAYSVHPVSVTPRIYSCDCPDFEYRRQQTGGYCKHILAVWMALYACCEAQRQERNAEELATAILAEVQQNHPAELAALLNAIAQRDGKAARTAAARLAGWPSRTRRSGTGAPIAAIRQLAA